MLPAIFRFLARAATGEEAAAGEGATAKSVVPFRKGGLGASRKPNKVIRHKPKVPVVRVAGKAVPTTVASRPRIRVNANQPRGDTARTPPFTSPFADASNATPPDTNTSDKYRRDTVPDKTTQLTPETDPEKKRPKEESDETLTRLLVAQQVAKEASSSFIPSTVWSASVSARGFKGTPLRTVLHYCLAVVFGMTHYFRLGHTTISVKLHPTENRVEVTFVMASSLLLEPLNMGFTFIKSLLQQNFDDARSIGQSEGIIAGIKKFVSNIVDPSKAANDFAKVVGDQMRLMSGAGIYDMARRDYFAGEPPLSMFIQDVEPFSSMVKQATVDKKPMLTRSLAMNPQADRIPNMHYPTFMDLRSLVAQALYDPGVLPPSPDTFVALPDQYL